MALNFKLCSKSGHTIVRNLTKHGLRTSATVNATPSEAVDDKQEFRTLDLRSKNVKRFTQFKAAPKNIKPVLPPRFKSQKIDQDWGNVWPAARTFHPATVPIPIRMGYPAPNKPTPSKWANAELMKIPNFLHLTPPVIERQCAAIKKFCTEWPSGLETPEEQEKNFPATVSKTTYLHSSPTIRDSKARVVTYRVSLKSLELDAHSRDKLLRLVGDRYDPTTDYLTLVADRCPLSKQNYDYCCYLISVLYSESVKKEPWEHEKEVLDREMYIWDGSPSQASVAKVLEAKEEPTPVEVLKEYEKVITYIHNEGEDEPSTERYKEAVLKIIGVA